MSRTKARAPGRVNIIGEHTDYNDGFVLPAAIGYETVAEAATTGGRSIAIESAAMSGAIAYELGSIPRQRAGNWTDYARGVLLELEKAGVTLQGMTLKVRNTVPVGSGLSSSASFEVALALGVLGISHASLDRLTIAKLCRAAETDYAGARAGIMDQFAVLFGRSHHATLLDTRSLAYEYVPVPAECRIVIVNSMVKHELASGEYNLRREQCEQAVEALRRWHPHITALRDVTPEQLNEHQSELPELLFRRARHVIAENDRVLAAVSALRRCDLLQVGTLMYASHESLRTDYEVSSKELDMLVEIARRCHGVYGARMTGGGFGGCTVNLVDGSDAELFADRVAGEYRAATGITPEFYDGTPVDGASYD